MSLEATTSSGQETRFPFESGVELNRRPYRRNQLRGRSSAFSANLIQSAASRNQASLSGWLTALAASFRHKIGRQFGMLAKFSLQSIMGQTHTPHERSKPCDSGCSKCANRTQFRTRNDLCKAQRTQSKSNENRVKSTNLFDTLPLITVGSQVARFPNRQPNQ
jgi:hypothetical protein